MKFRNLLLCLLLGIVLTGFANVYTYAAEENTVTKDTGAQGTATEQDTTDKSKDLNTTNDTVADNITSVSNSDAINESTETAETDSAKDDTTTERADDSLQEETLKEDTSKEDNTAKAEETKTKKVKKAVKKASTSKKTEAKKTKAKYSEADLRLLSALIYCEANAESYNGKLAVGIVVMNRVRSKAYPDTVKGVIYQKYQFGPASNGALSKALARYDKGRFTSGSEKDCIKAAKEALSGVTTITVNGKKIDFSKYLYFSGYLKGCTFTLGNHEFK